MDEGDEPYVFSCWMRSHRDACRGRLRKPPALNAYRLEVMRRVNECGVTIAVADADEATYCGFVCASPDLLHYVYVPHELRGLGLGKRLITHAMGDYAERIRCSHTWPFKSARFVLEARSAA